MNDHLRQEFFNHIQHQGGLLGDTIRRFLKGAEKSIDVSWSHGSGYVVVSRRGRCRFDGVLADFLTPLASGFEEKPLVWFLDPPNHGRFSVVDCQHYQVITLHPDFTHREAIDALRAALPFLGDIHRRGGLLASDLALALEGPVGQVSVNTGGGWGAITLCPVKFLPVNPLLADYLQEHSREFRGKPMIWHIAPIPPDETGFFQEDFGSYFVTTILPDHTTSDVRGALICALMSVGRGDLLPDDVRRRMEEIADGDDN